MFHLACVLLLVFAAQAADVLPRDESNCVDVCSRRTLFNIVWGCFSTTSICAWVAIHPNIPPRETPFKTMLRRLELMFWTILAPEILPGWALNQLLAAMTVRDVYNKEKGYEKERCGILKTLKGLFSLYEIKKAASKAWTLTHGHFLIMGGFQVVEPPEDGNTMGMEANTIADRGAASEKINVQPRSSALVSEDMEKAGKKHKPKEPKVTILTLEMLRELVKDPEFDIETTEDDITHMSKGDALSKIIFVFQTTWFILNCLGRHGQGLYLTQLEVTTLALASLNGITLALWWDKPLGAQAVVRVHLKRKLKDEERNAGQNQYKYRSRSIPVTQAFLEGRIAAIHDIILCRSEGNILVAWLIRLPLAILSILLSPIVTFGTSCLGVGSDPTGVERKVEGQSHSFRSRFMPEIQRFLNSRVTAIHNLLLCQSQVNNSGAWLIQLPFSILSLLLAPIIAFASAFFATWMDLVASDSFAAEDTHVPTFYVPNHGYSKSFHPALIIALATIFGGIHCAGWNIPFPTYTEQKLWRIASLAITIMPFPVGHFSYMIMRIVKFFRNSNPDSDESLLRLIFAISMFVYMSARLVLLVLALAILRHLPPTAFIDVDWTKFYPHLF